MKKRNAVSLGEKPIEQLKQGGSPRTAQQYSDTSIILEDENVKVERLEPAFDRVNALRPRVDFLPIYRLQLK